MCESKELTPKLVLCELYPHSYDVYDEDNDIPEVCPFCGNEDIEVTKEDCFGFDNDEWLIHCDNCGLQFGFGKQYKTKNEVIEAWNNNYRW